MSRQSTSIQCASSASVHLPMQKKAAIIIVLCTQYSYFIIIQLFYIIVQCINHANKCVTSASSVCLCNPECNNKQKAQQHETKLVLERIWPAQQPSSIHITSRTEVSSKSSAETVHNNPKTQSEFSENRAPVTYCGYSS